MQLAAAASSCTAFSRPERRCAAAHPQPLDDACPAELFVLIAPFAVRTDVSNEVQPDVLVARRTELTDKNLPAAPVLAECGDALRRTADMASARVRWFSRCAWRCRFVPFEVQDDTKGRA